MSVRRDTATDYSAGAGLIKSALFWVAMLTASFLLGFLVIAPLMHLTRARGDDSRVSAAQGGNTGNNGPRPNASGLQVAPTRETHKQNVEPDEPVKITPDPSANSNPSVQSGTDPTEAPRQSGEERAHGAEANSQGDEQPATRDEQSPSRHDRAGDNTDAGRADRSERRRETAESERAPSATSERSGERGDSANDAPATVASTHRTGRRHRSATSEQPGSAVEEARREPAPTTETHHKRTSRRTESDDSGSRRPSRSADDNGVQKSEGIDR